MSDFGTICEDMKKHGMRLPPDRVMLRLRGAKQVLKMAMERFLERDGVKAVWRPEYDEVGEWLENNDGKGLLMIGNCGTGKTFLGMYAIPFAICAMTRMPDKKIVSCYDMYEMNSNVDEIKKKRYVYLDDVGTESLLVEFGNKRAVFAEIMDNAEKRGNLIIASTNLDGEGIRRRYGDRVMERIRTTMRVVPFNGKSLRGLRNPSV